MENMLVTGKPRVGKTTLITSVVSELDLKVIGFVTKEIRKNGMRKGFEIGTFSGEKAILASRENKSSKYRVASYGVYVENLNEIVKKLLERMEKEKYERLIIDEIGKMELFSEVFKSFMEKALETKKVLGTIMLKENELTRRIRGRKDTSIFHLTRENWEKVKERVKREIKKEKKA
ncbi:MAG: nucleoside-triphosphatase [Candidatus Heimdallarchaeaceae archaeon]